MAGGDLVDQLMACERCLQARHRMGDALGNLDQVEVGGWRIGPPIDTATQRQNRAGVTQSVDAGIAQDPPLWPRGS
jgi:hypothetical protein